MITFDNVVSTHSQGLRFCWQDYFKQNTLYHVSLLQNALCLSNFWDDIHNNVSCTNVGHNKLATDLFISNKPTSLAHVYAPELNGM